MLETQLSGSCLHCSRPFPSHELSTSYKLVPLEYGSELCTVVSRVRWPQARLFIAVYQSNFDFLKWLRAEKEEAVTQLRKNYIDGMKVRLRCLCCSCCGI